MDAGVRKLNEQLMCTALQFLPGIHQQHGVPKCTIGLWLQELGGPSEVRFQDRTEMHRVSKIIPSVIVFVGLWGWSFFLGGSENQTAKS